MINKIENILLKLGSLDRRVIFIINKFIDIRRAMEQFLQSVALRQELSIHLGPKNVQTCFERTFFTIVLVDQIKDHA